MLEFISGGDAGFYIALGPEGIDAGVNARVHALARALEGTPGVTDLIPGYWNLFVEFDPLLTARARLEHIVRTLESKLEGAAFVGREHVIPVRYDGADLEAVAELTGLPTTEIIARHTSSPYTVYALGFTPGFPYLGTLEPALHVQRLAVPRAHTPAHSVAIAGAQTGIYPLPSPGGWRVIGSALRRVYDPHRAQPFLLEPGDRVRFQAVERGDLEPSTPAPDAALEGVPLFRVLETGLLSSVQDAGRRMVGRYGLARAGALDPRAAHAANALVGNASDAPVLEFALRGPTLEVLEPAVLALAGGGVRVVLNGHDLELHKSFTVRRGDHLEFPSVANGVRAYLAVRGGINGALRFGSRNTDLRAGLGGMRLEAGDVVHRLEAAPRAVRAGFAWTPPALEGIAVLRVTPGPQAALFPPEAWRTFLKSTYRVSSGDRMGVRLEGARLEATRFDITSEGVPVGAVQVNSSGQPMVLLNDRGTLGGYAKIAVLARSSLGVAAQLRPGARVRFALR
jgi:KipI family sensor histidine kinase inhibitor